MPLYIAYQSIYFFKNKHFESLVQFELQPTLRKTIIT